MSENRSFLESGGLLITPPQQEPPMMHMLVMDSLSNYNKGESIKPGNIKLNIRHLIELLPDITAATVEIYIKLISDLEKIDSLNCPFNE